MGCFESYMEFRDEVERVEKAKKERCQKERCRNLRVQGKPHEEMPSPPARAP